MSHVYNKKALLENSLIDLVDFIFSYSLMSEQSLYERKCLEILPGNSKICYSFVTMIVIIIVVEKRLTTKQSYYPLLRIVITKKPGAS